jgi:pimeloyl-ACP methyl ester carboxylesterase
MRFLPTIERIAHSAMGARGFESRRVKVDGFSVHVYDARGRGRLPPMVLIHGLGSAGTSFVRLVTLLMPHAKRVVVPELVGHGRSEHLPSGTEDRLTPDRLLDAMTVALDEVVSEPAVVCGNSLGGAVALAYAIRRPERVRALVLVSPAGAHVPEVEWRELLHAFEIRDRRSARLFLGRIYHRPPWFTALLAHEFPDVLRRQAVRDLLETSTTAHAVASDDLASLRMPTLLLWGRSDRLLPRTALAYFRKHLPAHAIVEEPEAFGHAPQIEDPRRVADRILRFARTLNHL